MTSKIVFTGCFGLSVAIIGYVHVKQKIDR
jgi:hypothetical protein